MKRLLERLLFICLLLSFYNVEAQISVNADQSVTNLMIDNKYSKASAFEYFLNNSHNSNLEYSISNWLDDKRAAVVLTFDDWSPGHPAIVIPELKKRKINATFFITNVLGTPDWNIVKNACDDGNEIANHTKSHLDLTKLSGDQKKNEIKDSKNNFGEKLKGGKILTFAYPFGRYDQVVIDSVRNSGHIAARGVQLSSGNYTYNFAPTEDDYYRILTYGMNSTITIAQFNSQIENIIKGGGLLTYLYHSIYNNTVIDNSYAQIHQNDLAMQLDTLLSRKNDVWICTFAQAIQYHREKKTAILTEVSKPFAGGNIWKVNLSDELNDNLYFQALTVKVKVPDKINKISSIYQNGKKLSFNISSGYLMFNAIPDGGEIIINIL
ncbi:MAG: polysaccharide deacetylase family protein [Sporocytophaga sp.]|uniref:polysaccharide deacetylase family protein n=1 Tax=Sporocytophaga sp. TaxID=2231183 RepID=UPI001B2D0854|nr:polysaccharide deacetylase family protein [Sporocytophaga sp.]MBO9699064.1 polysaccharide deacetylase family protein [Sporocytophaga sp.]